jgi:hypothetical protein
MAKGVSKAELGGKELADGTATLKIQAGSGTKATVTFTFQKQRPETAAPSLPSGGRRQGAGRGSR